MALGGHAILLTETVQRSKEVCTVNFVIFCVHYIMEDTLMKGEAKFGYGTMQYFLYSLAMVIRLYTYFVYYK